MLAMMQPPPMVRQTRPQVSGATKQPRTKNPLDAKAMARLQDAVDYANKKIEDARDHRVNAIREYVGAHYGENGSEDKVPLPLLGMAISIYLQYLAAQTPRVMVTTPHKETQADAADLELAMNHWMEDQNFGETHEAWVLDAMFSIGILKIGVDAAKTVELDGAIEAAGTPFAEVVDIDDATWDVGAKRWGDVSFIGNYYRMPLEAAKNCDTFEPAQRKKLIAADGPREGDSTESADEITNDIDQSLSDAFIPQVNLLDLYLPHYNIVMTINPDGDWKDALEVREWTGPQRGPYRILSFDNVPGNLLPLSPVATLIDLHQLSNLLFNKLGRQAQDEKTVGIALGGVNNTADAQKIMNASDGEVVAVTTAMPITEAHFGGINPANAAFTMNLRTDFSLFGGNLDALGGLSPQAPTLGQDQLLSNAASKRMERMQARTMGRTKEVARDIGELVYSDPLFEPQLTRTHPDFPDISVSFKYDESRKKADFFHYNFDIDPYSLEAQTPSTQLAKLMQIIQGVIMPLIPLMQAQGIGINMEFLLKQISKLSGLKNAQSLLIFGAGENQPDAGPTQSDVRPTKSPVTHRINERVSRSGASQTGKDAANVSMLMGMAADRLQPKQRAQIGKGVS